MRKATFAVDERFSLVKVYVIRFYTDFNNNNNNNNHNHHHPRWFVVVPPASSVGPSIAADSSSAQDRPQPWTRFRHNPMTPAPDTPPLPRIPFRPRQRRADAPPIPTRRTNRAARFRAIRSRQASLTSRAACARYRLGRKTAIRPRALMRRLDCVQKHLIMLHKNLLHLLDTRTLLSPAAFASVIHDVERASSLCRSLSAAAPPHSIPGDLSSLSTLLHGPLKLTMPPCVPSSTSAAFFGG
ncbi:hypothetical protein B0H13DRAFT_1851240 [Mycena leptocephala]|nr:hypothetical protein B0H13DRAFT_1851240 [Mycena leptocephala]